jgi:hypothetical protein
MSETVKPPGANPFLTHLDGEIVTLPGKSLESMMGMFAHLESLALRRGKISAALADASKSPGNSPKQSGYGEGELDRISYRELGRQVIRAAQTQIRVLQNRTQEIQSLILINNWKVADQLWAELLPDCKTPLFELNFLEELWGISPDNLEVGGWTLTRHWQQFVLIQAEVEVLLARRQSLMQLSDTLEGHLGLWLKRFADILDKLDEKSAA